MSLRGINFDLMFRDGDNIVVVTDDSDTVYSGKAYFYEDYLEVHRYNGGVAIEQPYSNIRFIAHDGVPFREVKTAYPEPSKELRYEVYNKFAPMYSSRDISRIRDDARMDQSMKDINGSRKSRARTPSQMRFGDPLEIEGFCGEIVAEDGMECLLAEFSDQGHVGLLYDFTSVFEIH